MVSIIIPFYNRIDYVKRAVESVIKQSYADWEIILVDDCGTEKLDIQHSFGAEYLSKIKLVSNKQNLGPGLSRQAGLGAAAGEFVCFLDSDDYYHQDFLKMMLNSLNLAPDAAGVYCTTLNATDGKIRKASNINYNYIMPFIITGMRPWATASWVWRKSQIGEWGELRTNEDWLFEINTSIINNNIRHCDFPLCYIDGNTGQNIRNNSDSYLADIDRNIVINYAIYRLDSYRGQPHFDQIKSTLYARLIYISSKLITRCKHKIILVNSFKLMRYSIPKGFFLLILGITLTPSAFQRRLYKKMLTKLV